MPGEKQRLRSERQSMDVQNAQNAMGKMGFKEVKRLQVHMIDGLGIRRFASSPTEI